MLTNTCNGQCYEIVSCACWMDAATVQPYSPWKRVELRKATLNHQNLQEIRFNWNTWCPFNIFNCESWGRWEERARSRLPPILSIPTDAKWPHSSRHGMLTDDWRREPFWSKRLPFSWHITFDDFCAFSSYSSASSNTQNLQFWMMMNSKLYISYVANSSQNLQFEVVAGRCPICFESAAGGEWLARLLLDLHT